MICHFASQPFRSRRPSQPASAIQGAGASSLLAAQGLQHHLALLLEPRDPRHYGQDNQSSALLKIRKPLHVKKQGRMLTFG